MRISHLTKHNPVFEEEGGGNAGGESSSRSGAGGQENARFQSSSGGERPNFIPEKFWDAERGQPRLEELGKSYSELETFRGRREEEIKEALKKEMTGQVPESPDKYEIPKIEDPRINPELLAKSPVLTEFREMAHKNGLNNDQFQTYVKWYIDQEAKRQPVFEDEYKKIGENAKERISQVNTFLKDKFSEDEYKQFEQFSQRAEGFTVIEKLYRMASGQNQSVNSNFGSESSGAQPGMSLEEARRLMASPAYFDPARRDPAVVKKVDAFFANRGRQ